MNIRKKILYNPSNLKSAKPDYSDNTTANTKNSAILEQSKTFRLTNDHQFSTRRSKNYLRTLSKEIKKQNSVYVQNIASSLIKKNHVMPSFSTLSNQNLPPLKKGIINRKFIVESEELPPLTSGKRPTILSSQNERKPPIIPSCQINSNKDLLNPNSLSRKQFHRHGKIPINRILGNEVQEIQRRKQQLNSMNVGSFYTTQKSIALSKFSIGSKRSSRNDNLSKNSDAVSIQRQKRPSQFMPQKKQQEIQKSEQVDIIPQTNTEESMQESIAEEIERNKSVNKEKVKNEKKQLKQNDNQWNQTLKSSLYESKTVQVRVTKKDQKLDTQSSLCESEQIDDRQLQQKKKTCRLMRSQKKSSQKKFSFNKDEDFCLKTFKSQQQQSSLCQSYQMQTPQKHYKSKQMNSNLNKQKLDQQYFG